MKPFTKALTRTAAALSTSLTGYPWALIQAHPKNTGNVYIGDANNQYFQLSKGQSTLVGPASMGTVYVRSSVSSGDKVTGLAATQPGMLSPGVTCVSEAPTTTTTTTTTTSTSTTTTTAEE